MIANEQTTAPELTATLIPVALIDPSPLNRNCEAEDGIAELAQTILGNGLLSPISARPMTDGRYEIICGERRWRAFRWLERDTIPCFIKNLDDTQAQIERIVENYQRRDPSFLEQGEAVAALMKLTDSDVYEVANRLGQSVSWVRRRAKLPNLIAEWRVELAKDKTPYVAIRDSVNRLEEISVLPVATQRAILDSGLLRYAKTYQEMRKMIAKLFMDLDAKPWTRSWEKKAYSGSGKKRCDACMKRSDRESALFADPNDPNIGKKMCLDAACWKAKSLAWSRDLIKDNPGMIPIRQNYTFGNDNLTDYFGVKPISYYDWQERDDTETEKEGYGAATGVFVDGVEIGTKKCIWLRCQDDDADEDDEANRDISDAHNWREIQVRRHHAQSALAEIIRDDITAYLADVDENTTISTAQLSENKIRACFWFGVRGVTGDGEDEPRIDNPAWEPLATAWEGVTEHIAEFIAGVAAEGIAQLYNGDRDYSTDSANAAALVEMFAIPLDVIAVRATDALYKATCVPTPDHHSNLMGNMEETTFDSGGGNEDMTPLDDSYLDENDTINIVFPLADEPYLYSPLHSSEV